MPTILDDIRSSEWDVLNLPPATHHHACCMAFVAQNELSTDTLNKTDGFTHVCQYQGRDTLYP